MKALFGAATVLCIVACVASEPTASPVVLGCDPATKKVCAGVCVDKTDVAFGCGGAACAPCDVAHAALAVCLSDGRCGVGKCANRWGDCDVDPANGCERDLLSATDCGACGTSCPGGQLCAFRGCTADCKTKNQCGNICIDPDNDERNCGGCGVVCPTDPHGAAQCVDGSCVVACDDGYARCNGGCAPLVDADGGASHGCR